MTPLFITAERLKKFGIIDSNVDNHLIEPTIIMVQDEWLQQLLGTDLYFQICDQVKTNTVSSQNLILLNEYIENFLHYSVVAEGLITFNYRISNKAVVTANSDNQFPVSTKEIERIEKKWTGKAEFWGKRLTEYLCANANTYPLYRNANTESNKLKPRKQNYSSGMFLGNARRRYGCGRCNGHCNGHC